MRVLMVSRDRELGLLRQAVLKAQGVTCVLCENEHDALTEIERQSFDAMAVCHTIPEEEMVQLHRVFTRRNPASPVVLIQRDWGQPKKDDPDAVVLGVEGPKALKTALERAAPR